MAERERASEEVRGGGCAIVGNLGGFGKGEGIERRKRCAILCDER